MPRTATVRELKNGTTALIREAERGGPVIVTRRGKPVATLRRFSERDLAEMTRYPTTAHESLKMRIASKHPGLARETEEEARREFERATARIRRSLPFRSWQEMDRFAKGAHRGLSR